MPTEPLREELKQFERELARLVAHFMKLYDRLEKEARPEMAKDPPMPLVLRAAAPPTLIGYQ